MLAAAVAEDVTVAFRRAWPSGKRGLEPGVQVGGMVGDDIDDDLDTGLVRGFGELVEIVHRTEFRVDVAVIVDIVPAVGELARIEGAEPNRVDAQLLEVADAAGNTGDVAEAGTGGVLERARIDLIDHRLMPPGRCGAIRCRGFLRGLWGLALCHALSFLR